MRMLDRYGDDLFAGRKDGFTEAVRGAAVPVDCTPAYEWIRKSFYDKKEWDFAGEFPTVLSPWNIAWYEYRKSDTVWGILWVQNNVEDLDEYKIGYNCDNLDVRGCKWAVVACIYFGFGDTVAYLGRVAFPIDSNGGIVSRRIQVFTTDLAERIMQGEKPWDLFFRL